MSNKMASFIAIIVIAVGFIAYDRFKPLKPKELISKQGLVTLTLDSSYKNIDSSFSPEGTLLAQQSKRHDISVIINAARLTETEKELSLEEYAETMYEALPDPRIMQSLTLDHKESEIHYTLHTPDAKLSTNRLHLSPEMAVVIAVISEPETPKEEIEAILNSAQFQKIESIESAAPEGSSVALP